MKKHIILAAVLFVLLAVVFIQNPGEVTYRIYFWKISISQMILLPLTFAAGIFIGFSLAKLRRSKPRP
jgi:uncharacterized integral membrane protein